MLNLQKKSQWIACELNADADDVFDVLTGMITRPLEFYNNVLMLSDEYDLAKSRGERMGEANAERKGDAHPRD